MRAINEIAVRARYLRVSYWPGICPEFPVDMVYTWVDGSDPVWLEKKERALGYGKDTGDIQPGSADPSRFRNRDELKYSLRSVSMFAPFVRKIFLVTDGQVPQWLNRDAKRIQVVFHREFFSEYVSLPTFNSHVIASQVHHLPGLSEYYLLMNDDIFFAHTVRPALFYTRSGKTLFFPSFRTVGTGPVNSYDTAADAAAKNVRDLLRQEMGMRVRYRIAHAPHSQKRSILFELDKRFDREMRLTASHPFRHYSDIRVPSMLYHYYALSQGMARQGYIRYATININESGYEEQMRERLLKKSYDTFCLNESSNPVEPVEPSDNFIREFLEKMFPRKSEFEI